MNAVARGDRQPHPSCELTNGQRCAISPNEVRQLMATGTRGGVEQTDDVDFSDPELQCPDPGCTDPFAALPALTATRPIFSPLATTKSYPAREGHDQFYGYGRVNMVKAITGADAGVLPPEVELSSPEWYEQVDPRQETFAVRGTVFARGEPYTCRVLVAPGAYPNDGDEPTRSDFQPVPSGACDGSTQRSGSLEGLLGNVNVAALKARYPPATAGGFDGRETGSTGQQPHNGRPNSAPYGFVVKVVATSVGGTSRTGEDRRQGFLHRDSDLLPGFPKELLTDGASSPLFVDLEGDNENELVFGTSDGFVHALERDGSSVPGWPVRTDALPLHDGGKAFSTGGVSKNFGGAVLASPATGDFDRDGSPEIVVADLEGKVTAWNAQGQRVFSQESRIEYSGKPLSPFADVRKGKRYRTQHGFIGSPVIGDLDRDGRQEIVAASMDRHLYAWKPDGLLVDGYPVLVVDPSKVASVDPQTDAVTFSPAAGSELNQGAIVDTPAIANIAGAADSPPEIVLGTNEEYRVNQGNEGPFNASPVRNSAAISALQTAGTAADLSLANANGRVYALHADGDKHQGGPFVEGWPVKLGLLMAELLPVVGEGVNGSPVIAPVTCPPPGGQGRKVGVIPAAGLGYILNGDGTSCYGQDVGLDVALQSDAPGSEGLDANRFPAVGLPAFGTVAGRTTFLAPTAGLLRALDLAANEYQGGADGLAAWNTETGQYLPKFPAQVNDLSFLTGPSVADVDGLPGEEMVAGTASMDLQAFNAAGEPASDRWPRLHGDWMVATPLVGSFGQRETD
ncbi:MAG: VCBS repeat-containing protein, partial [Actinomycetota bacterium]|nr:VCBS repeat-containing protein [Actinomycetota bacterium]